MKLSATMVRAIKRLQDGNPTPCANDNTYRALCDRGLITFDERNRPVLTNAGREWRSDDWHKGYASGYKNAVYSGENCIGVNYIPTAEERAASIDFKGNEDHRSGWLAGWSAAVGPFREFQKREMSITSVMQLIERRKGYYFR